jgi:hypothetical protein
MSAQNEASSSRCGSAVADRDVGVTQIKRLAAAKATMARRAWVARVTGS